MAAFSGSSNSGRRGLVDWYDLLLRDHGFLRFFWHNRHLVSGGVFRSNQPAPWDIAWAARHGIKTVVNLRGGLGKGSWRLEKAACDAAGMTLIDFNIRSRAVPDRATIEAASRLFDTVEYPILLHCKSGADRAGLMSALYLLLKTSSDFDAAAAMLSFRYLHVRQAKTGLLDAFLAAYRPFYLSGKGLLDWAAEDLDPHAIERDFMASGWANRLVDDILRRK